MRVHESEVCYFVIGELSFVIDRHNFVTDELSLVIEVCYLVIGELSLVIRDHLIPFK